MMLNVVPKVKNISQQNPNINLQPSGFQDDQDSTYKKGLVNQSSKKTFNSNAGLLMKVMSPGNQLRAELSRKPKIHAKRDVAIAPKEQNEPLKRVRKKILKKRSEIHWVRWKRKINNSKKDPNET